jgi:hypothetical protein
MFALVLSSSSLAQHATGRYRCYEPPSYSVMAWFDLTAKDISVNGNDPVPIRIDAAGGRIDLPPDAIPPWRFGWPFAPGAKDGDAERVTLVLARRADQRPGNPAWVRLPRCYLTTH